MDSAVGFTAGVVVLLFETVHTFLSTLNLESMEVWGLEISVPSSLHCRLLCFKNLELGEN